NSVWTGPAVTTVGNALNLTGVTTIDAPALFPNGGGGFTSFSGSGINVASGAALNVSGAATGGADLVKLGGGQLELSGSLANSISQAPRVKQGTLLLNKAPGVTAINTAGTISVGDGLAGNTAVLRLARSNQFGPISNIPSIQVASNGTFDMTGRDQLVANLTIEVGAVGAGQVIVGAGGTLTVAGNVTVQALGGGVAAAGAVISGGTLALNTFNATATTRTFTVNDAAAGTDLTVSSAIVDGSGVASSALVKNGFGTLQF